MGKLKAERSFRTRQGGLLAEEAMLIFFLKEERFPDQGLGGRNREMRDRQSPTGDEKEEFPDQTRGYWRRALLTFFLEEGRFPDRRFGDRSGFVRLRRDEDRSSGAASGSVNPAPVVGFPDQTGKWA